MAQTFASFQLSGNIPKRNDLLKSLHRGTDNSEESSFSSRLFILSGPYALPDYNDFNICLTSEGLMDKRSGAILVTIDSMFGGSTLLSLRKV